MAILNLPTFIEQEEKTPEQKMLESLQQMQIERPPVPAVEVPRFTRYGNRMAERGGFDVLPQEQLSGMTQQQIDEYEAERRKARGAGISETLLRVGQAFQGLDASGLALERQQARQQAEMQSELNATIDQMNIPEAQKSLLRLLPAQQQYAALYGGEKRQTYKPELEAFKNHTTENINVGGIIVKPGETRSFNVSNPDIANALMNTAGLEQASKGTVYTRQGGLYKTPDGTYRELLIGDQQVFKGKKGTLTTEEFYNTYAQDEISTTTAGEGYRYNLDKKSFDKLNSEIVDLEKGFLQLERYWENIKDSNIGIARLGDQISQWYKTLQGDTGLSYEELKRGVASGQLQRLIGANRIDTVGGGVMTEKDAWRVIEGLGGDVTALQNPAIVSEQLQDMYLYKTLDYNKAIKSYNDEINTGNFPSYKEKTPIEKQTVINKFNLLPEGVPVGSVKKISPNGVVYYLDETTNKKYIIE